MLKGLKQLLATLVEKAKKKKERKQQVNKF